MIPRLNRLPSTRLFQAVNISTTHLVLKIAQNNLFYHRFAFVVGKKIDKRAVIRNRCKRLLREIFFEQMLPYSKGLDLVCIVKKPCMDIPREALQKEISEVINKATQA